MYIQRAIENSIQRILKQYKVILLTGPRQVGKTTLLQKQYGTKYKYVNLDNINDLTLAKSDQQLFFQKFSMPLIIDEVQYAPELFRQIKYLIDQGDEKGKVILTGSQTYNLLHGTSESLAGRIAILSMPSLSLREITKSSKNAPYLPSLADLEARENLSWNDIWKILQRGFMPTLQDETMEWELYYSNYVRTYIEKDIRQIVNIKDESSFYKFLVALAARTGQMLVLNELAAQVGVSAPTIKNWISLLETSGIIRLLMPYHNNFTKRLVKTPKVFFMDTGLVCFLLGWNTPQVLANGAMAGNIFETFVVSEIFKGYLNAGRDINNIFYYRDHDQKEIDLLIKDGDVLYPIEVKVSATPQKKMIGNFAVLNNLKEVKVGRGALICMCQEATFIDENNIALPVDCI